MCVESYAFDGGVGGWGRRGFEEVDYVGVSAGFLRFGCIVWGGVGDSGGVGVDWGGPGGGLAYVRWNPFSSDERTR